jgi:hypothetical protein
VITVFFFLKSAEPQTIAVYKTISDQVKTCLSGAHAILRSLSTYKYKWQIGYKAALIALLKKYGNHSVVFDFAKRSMETPEVF